MLERGASFLSFSGSMKNGGNMENGYNLGPKYLVVAHLRYNMNEREPT